MSRYTLIAYKASSSTWDGCHCHGREIFHDSDLVIEQDLTLEELEKSLFRYMTVPREGKEQGYEFAIFEDGVLGFSNIENQSCDENDGIRSVFEQAKIKAKAALEAQATAEKAKAEAKKEADKKAAEKLKEERERVEFERLKTKFQPKES